MKFVMMARNENLYSHMRLKEAAEQRGHSMQIINTLRCYMNIASRRPEVYYNGESLEGFDAVIPRIGASVTFYGLAVLCTDDEVQPRCWIAARARWSPAMICTALTRLTV